MASPVDRKCPGNRPTFSFVIASRGRTTELHQLFASLAEEGQICECIVVDQNQDDRLGPVLKQWQTKLSILHLKSGGPGLSAARNVGILHATGELLGFPDDDCWYSPNLLPRVANFFAEHPDYAMLSAGVRDESGALSGNRWFRPACDLAPANLFRTSVGMALFLRRSRVPTALHFDPTLGVGAQTVFGSGEDTDYVFRLMSTGLRGRYDRSYTVYHPRRDLLSGQTNPSRAFSYGCGMGRVLRKRAHPLLLLAFLAFDFLRMLASLVRGRMTVAALCAAHGRGIFSGYMAAD